MHAPQISRRRALVAAAVVAGAAPHRARADEVLHIIDYPVKGACGEALVPDKGVPFAKAFGGLSEGSCASEGYATQQGSAPGTKDKDKDRSYSIYVK